MLNCQPMTHLSATFVKLGSKRANQPWMPQPVILNLNFKRAQPSCLLTQQSSAVV